MRFPETPLFTRVSTGIAAAVLTFALWPTLAVGQQTSRSLSVLMLFSLRSTAPTVTNVEATFRRVLEEKLGSAGRSARRIPRPARTKGLSPTPDA